MTVGPPVGQKGQLSPLWQSPVCLSLKNVACPTRTVELSVAELVEHGWPSQDCGVMCGQDGPAGVWLVQPGLCGQDGPAGICALKIIMARKLVLVKRNLVSLKNGLVVASVTPWDVSMCAYN